MLNAQAALDLGVAASSLEPPLRTSLTVPLSHDGRVVGVLSCYLLGVARVHGRSPASPRARGSQPGERDRRGGEYRSGRVPGGHGARRAFVLSLVR
ncbi:MAG TPA: hypothetical protein VFT24_13190 [Vicinamibacterales bacterium]|nr:hypothetical protein [Vicinamibacterales bacterium]